MYVCVSAFQAILFSMLTFESSWLRLYYELRDAVRVTFLYGRPNSFPKCSWSSRILVQAIYLSPLHYTRGHYACSSSGRPFGQQFWLNSVFRLPCMFLRGANYAYVVRTGTACHDCSLLVKATRVDR